MRPGTVPDQKLSPDQTFSFLSKYAGFTTEYELGMSELGDELAYLNKQAGLKNPIQFPTTVGDLIHQLIRAAEQSDS